MTDSSSQREMIQRDLERLAQDHKDLNARFDRHLEIYSQNGKELAALKVSVDGLKETLDGHAKRSLESHNTIASQTANNTKRITNIEIDISRLAVKIGTYAAVGSAAASAVAVIAVQRIFS